MGDRLTKRCSLDRVYYRLHALFREGFEKHVLIVSGPIQYLRGQDEEGDEKVCFCPRI